MSEPNRSERIISALAGLQQFLPCAPGVQDNHIVNVLNGVRVEPTDTGEDAENGLLQLTFPGGTPITVIGEIYLALMVAQSAQLEIISPGEGTGAISDRAQELLEHLNRKYEL